MDNSCHFYSVNKCIHKTIDFTVIFILVNQISCTFRKPRYLGSYLSPKQEFPVVIPLSVLAFQCNFHSFLVQDEMG